LIKNKIFVVVGFCLKVKVEVNYKCCCRFKLKVEAKILLLSTGKS